MENIVIRFLSHLLHFAHLKILSNLYLPFLASLYFLIKILIITYQISIYQIHYERKFWNDSHIIIYSNIWIPYNVIITYHIASISFCLFWMAWNALSIFYSLSVSVHQRWLHWSWKKKEAEVSFNWSHLCYFVHWMNIFRIHLSISPRNSSLNEHEI